jgi:thioredoxin 1
MKNVDSTQFSSEVLGSKEPVVVDFYTQDCPPCRALSPILEEWESESSGRFKVLKVDAATETALASSYGVRAVPAVFLFSNGKCIGHSIGLKSKAGMKKWYEDTLRSESQQKETAPAS